MLSLRNIMIASPHEQSARLRSTRRHKGHVLVYISGRQFADGHCRFWAPCQWLDNEVQPIQSAADDRASLPDRFSECPR
ncbi:hypothetical protein NXT3_PB00346 (plasmid) [Sinorhizobium fredii]|uniref:Uncharacterized protein n=1 Tax=Rhizobium fredii TaxID=380 RepID=A0A2L0HBX1_RHIFR|nr:hypothetical protein NXT3_PB00346 [Sinorhizobium fredii]